jgi:hypothetical protein
MSSSQPRGRGAGLRDAKQEDQALALKTGRREHRVAASWTRTAQPLLEPQRSRQAERSMLPGRGDIGLAVIVGGSG